ncbi:MAG: hypothetical protein ACTHJV_08935 [Rhizobiaceae bacterium]
MRRTSSRAAIQIRPVAPPPATGLFLFSLRPPCDGRNSHAYNEAADFCCLSYLAASGTMIRVFCQVIAWLLLAGIIFVTVSPIGLRPDLGEGPNLDRVIGFLVTGFFFGVGYGRHWIMVLLAVVAGAFAIEALQLLTPDRHARLIDASVKAVSGGAGFLIGHASLAMRLKRG